MTIKISRNEVLSIDYSDVFHCYQDLWKTAQERSDSQYQGIDLSDDQNMHRICVGAGNMDETETEDAAIALAFGNRFHIPLDFELLETHMPFYQSALGDRLEYELTFNDLSRGSNRKDLYHRKNGMQHSTEKWQNRSSQWKMAITALCWDRVMESWVGMIHSLTVSSFPSPPFALPHWKCISIQWRNCSSTAFTKIILVISTQVSIILLNIHPTLLTVDRFHVVLLLFSL